MSVFFAFLGFFIGSVAPHALPFSVIGWTAMGWMLGNYLKSREEAQRRSRDVEDLIERVNRLAQRLRALEGTGARPAEETPTSEEAAHREPRPTAPARSAEEPPAPRGDVRAPQPPKGYEYRPPDARRDERPATEGRPVPPPRPTPPRPTPREPSGASQLADSIIRFFTTGNVFAKVGALLLLVGVAFLIKFVSEQGLFPIEGRLIACALGANFLIVAGWRLREKQRGYALILQGAGFGIFFLTVFGAYRLWHLIPAPLSLGLLVAATVLFCLLAILQDALALAALAVTGGFSAPLLIQTGSANHVALFSYYALLNSAIFAIAWFKPWRELNLIGFLFTYVVGWLWGARFYVPEHFTTVEPFLLFHFLLYVAVSLLFSRLQFALTKAFVVDGLLVFGVPMATFALQASMLKDTRYGIAISAAALGVFYVTLASVLYRRSKENIRALVESFLSSGILFNTLAVPFAVSHTWTATTWALEGALLVFMGARQGRRVMRYFGFALQALAYVAFLFKPIDAAGLAPILNPAFVGSLALFASGLFIAYTMFRAARKLGEAENRLLWIFVGAGTFWWIFGLYRETMVCLLHWYGPAASPGTIDVVADDVRLVLLGISVLLFHGLARLLAWPAVTLIRLALLPVPFFLLPMGDSLRQAGFAPFANPFYVGIVLLTVASLASALALFRQRERLPAEERALAWGFVAVGYVFWIVGHWVEINAVFHVWFESPESLHGMSLYGLRNNAYYTLVALSALGFYALGTLCGAPEIGILRKLLTAFGALFLVGQMSVQGSPLANLGAIPWALLFGVHYLLLKRDERRGEPFAGFQHFSGLWLGTLVLVWLGYDFGHTHIDPRGVWKYVFLLAIPGAVSSAVILWPRSLFPVGAHRKEYVAHGLLPHVIVLTLGSQLLSLTSDGNPAPLPFYPVVNPLGILGGFSIIVLVTWYRETRGTKLAGSGQTFAALVGALVFAWLTMGMIRSLHYFADVPWTLEGLLSSRKVQTGLSIFWGILGLLTMFLGNRKAWRYLWIFGCCLMIVVVVKVLAIDLKEKGTLERIISFIGTGVLLLLTGYFAPIPPSKKRPPDENI